MLQKPNESRNDVAALLTEIIFGVPSGAVTTIAAGTTSAGHLLALQWTSATSKFQLRWAPPVSAGGSSTSRAKKSPRSQERTHRT